MAYFGVYLGVVANSSDPMRSGRVQVRVPSLGSSTEWALVAAPLGSPPTGAVLPGTNVIVAFERGDPARPVVLGKY